MVAHETDTFVPAISFPEFPKIQRTVLEDGSWLMPKESAISLAVYYTQIETARKNYEMLRELYEKKNENRKDVR